MSTSVPLPAGLPVDGTSWEQAPLVVCQLIIHLLAVIQQQAAQIAALEARVSQHSCNSDRPPSSDPPSAPRIACSGARGLWERRDREVAHFGRQMLSELQRLVQWAQAPPTPGAVQTWYARMVHLLSQRRPRRDEAGTFARTLEREMGALWTFVVEEGVEPTNNQEGRALRFAVLWRKLMQGTYNGKGDRRVERILTVREICRLRGRPTFPVLVEAVTCSFNGQPPDVPWI